MNRISAANSGYWCKRIFAVVWYGFMVFAEIKLLMSAKPVPPLALVAPLAMIGLGFYVMKKFLWVLADEVWDEGDSLLVKKDKTEARIPLDQIQHVEFKLHTKSRIVWLTLKAPSPWGTTIAFAPRQTFSDILRLGFTSEIADRLKSRLSSH